jgi:hypothetical protein
MWIYIIDSASAFIAWLSAGAWPSPAGQGPQPFCQLPGLERGRKLLEIAGSSATSERRPRSQDVFSGFQMHPRPPRPRALAWAGKDDLRCGAGLFAGPQHPFGIVRPSDRTEMAAAELLRIHI